MPSWLTKLFTVRSWKMVFIPVSLTILSVLVAGVTVSCDSYKEHLGASDYFSQFSDHVLSGLCSSFLLMYKLDFSIGGQIVSVQSDFFLGLVAMLAGMGIAVWLTKNPEEGLRMTGPYWVLSIVAAIVIGASESGESSFKPFPMLIFAFITPPLVGYAVKLTSLVLAGRGMLQLSQPDEAYGIAVGQALEHVKQAGIQVAGKLHEAGMNLKESIDSAAAQHTSSSANSAPEPPPSLPVEAGGKLHHSNEYNPTGDERSAGNSESNSNCESTVSDKNNTPVAQPVAAVAEVSPANKTMSFAAVCPFCGNHDINHEQPGICGQCHRNLKVVLERADAPQCETCEGLLVRGAKHCHHCGTPIGESD